MQFRILGPVEAWDNGESLGLGGPQQRALLAVLLLNANRVVSADRLITDLWGEEPPPDARGLLRGCVARLRRALRHDQTGDEPDPLVTRPPGYLLTVAPGALDVHRVDELEAAANRLLAGPAPGALERAAELLREALGLWRGPALDDLTVGSCQAYAARLEERRLALLEQRVDVDLRLGRHADLAGELGVHVRDEPLRERLWAQLMLALCGADRRADALAAFRRLRQLLVDELGMEPSATLRELERAILTGADAFGVYRQAYGVAGDPPATDDPGPAPEPVGTRPAGNGPSSRPTPAQLPADIAGFVGRVPSLARLDTALAGTGGERPGAVVINAIAGTAGVGKTALAVHWAHGVRDHFPDGQLYVDLRGYAPTPPVRPIEALTGFLYALGVPVAQAPVDLDQAASLYRSVLADRRLLIVLDNARGAEQVRPLLPGGPGCLVLVTSRNRLGGLVARDGAYRVALDVLDPAEATALLAHVIGAERVAAEPEATAELARACAWLPLALRIAAAALTDAPGRSIASYVAELDEGDRLAALAVDGDDDTAVRATLDLSYATLTAAERRLFRLLGVAPGHDVTALDAAALTDTTAGPARTVLDRLAGAHLLGQHAPGRYAFHDLLRAYAAERARAEETEPDRRAAIRRLLDHRLRTVDAAARLLYPDKVRLRAPPGAPPADAPPATIVFDDHAQAAAWLDTERPNLVAAITYAAEHGPRSYAWRLADVLRGYFWLRRSAVDWLVVAQAGLAAAEASGEPDAVAAAHLSLADAHRCQAMYDKAIEHYSRVVSIAGPAGWLDAQSAALGNLGLVYWQLGRLPEAADMYTRSLELSRQTNRLGGQAVNLGNLGLIYRDLGRLELAADHYSQALVLYRKIGSRGGEAVELGNLGETYHWLGRLDDAHGHLTEAMALYRQLGEMSGEAEALRILAEVHRDAGRDAQAHETAEAALALARENGDARWVAEVLTTLASIVERRGRYAEAIALYEQGLRLIRESGTRYPEITALIGLATAYRGLDRCDRALEHAEQGLVLAGQAGYRVLEGQALTALADVHLALGRCDPAAQRAQQALVAHLESGHRLGQARALVLLGQVRFRSGAADAAIGHWRQARALFAAVGAPEADEVRGLLHACAAGGH